MNHRERDILIQQLLDGEIPPERSHELQDLLLRDADARKRFYDYVDLHQGLCFSRPAGRGKQRKLGPLLRSVQQRRMIRQTVIGAAAAVHIAVAVPNLDWDMNVSSQYLADDVVAEPMRIADGHVAPPSDGPGLGITVDEDKIARYRRA